MVSGSKQATEATKELMKAMTRLRARLREESRLPEAPWTWSQLATLGRIVREGPTTTSTLAQREHVRRQSMTETVATLRAEDLIRYDPDPADGHRARMSASDKGQTLIKTIADAREAWLDTTMQELLGPAELNILLEAAAIMNRIADHEV